MKRNLFCTILILISSLYCQAEKKEVTIKGKIIGDIPDEISYSIPVNGVCYGFFKSSEKVDSTGHFELRLDIERPSLLEVFAKPNTANLILEPGGNYNLIIESGNGGNKYTVGGKDSLIQAEYQKLVHPVHPQIVARSFMNHPISTAKRKIDSQQKEEFVVFDKLLNNGGISEELYQLLKTDRALFYNCVKGQVAMVNFFKTKVNDLSANTDSINQMWYEAISDVPLNSDYLLGSKWAYNYLGDYLQYHEYTMKDFSFDIRTKARAENTIHSYLLGMAKKHLSKENLEFYTAAYMLFAARQKNFEKELVGLFKAYQADFAESKYTPYLKPEIEKIIDFHKKAELSDDSDIKFLDHSGDMNSLKKCSEQFKGQKIYVDIWATSCGYCKDEFKHSEKLSRLITSKNMAMLYISLDRDNNDQQWKDMIKYYGLKGYHIRANKELSSDLEVLLGSFGIPRYLIIDEKGNVINDNAKKPSQISELEKQLNNN